MAESRATASASSTEKANCAHSHHPRGCRSCSADGAARRCSAATRPPTVRSRCDSARSTAILASDLSIGSSWIRQLRGSRSPTITSRGIRRRGRADPPALHGASRWVKLLSKPSRRLVEMAADLAREDRRSGAHRETAPRRRSARCWSPVVRGSGCASAFPARGHGGHRRPIPAIFGTRFDFQSVLAALMRPAAGRLARPRQGSKQRPSDQKRDAPMAVAGCRAWEPALASIRHQGARLVVFA